MYTTCRFNNIVLFRLAYVKILLKDCHITLSLERIFISISFVLNFYIIGLVFV